MKPIWISSTKAAELLGISDRQVRRSVSMWNYRWSEKDGRKVLEIDVRSLPAEASNRYVQETLPEATEVATRAEDVETVIRSYDRATDRAKKNFDKWTLILLKCEGITGTKELGRFVDEWNKAHPEMKTSIKSIYRQRASVEDCGKIALINHRETMKSTVTDAMFDDFKTAYLTANKISVYSSWMIALGKAMERGECKDESDFPSKSAFVRRLKNEYAPDVIYFAREGKKKFYDNKGYHLDRDYSDLKAGEVWVGDTRTWDVFVKVQGQEKPATCYITLFIDFKTYMPMGWCLHHDAPGTENTLRALRNGIQRYGIPENIYVDNGREYRNKDFSGQSRGHQIVEDEQYAESLASRLGIKMHFAIVRNARAKVIERNFLIIKNGFDRLFNSFKGGTVVEKPEPLKGVLKRGDFATWEEFYDMAQDYMQNVFPGLPCQGKHHNGKTRSQLWNEEIVKREPMRRVSKDTLSMLVSRTVSGRIRHMGFYLPQLDSWYWAEWMPVWKGREVIFRYDPDDMRTAWCYDQNKKLIGECALQSAVGAMVKDDDAVGKAQIAEGVARKRHEEKLLKEICPDMTKEQAADYISAMRTAVGPQDIFVPQGPTHLTRHDKDAQELRTDRKVGNADFYNLLGDDVEERESTDLWDELSTGEAM
ncbi:MAG: transposase [Fibrobacter sp.]|nr:transposase [Fibrobacter sp.]